MINILIPMCGAGSRLKQYSSMPKPLISVQGKTLLSYSIESLNINGHYIFIKPLYDKQNEELFLKILEENNIKSYTVIIHNDKTEGASASALLAKELIDNNSPLIITNCDQYLTWNSERFLKKIELNDCDSILVTFKSDNTQHSYAKSDNANKVIEVKEKEVISNDALVGIHYWRKGSDFVLDAEYIIKNNIRFKNEFYISTTVSSLISREKTIHLHRLENESFFPLGSCADLEFFLTKQQEA